MARGETLCVYAGSIIVLGLNGCAHTRMHARHTDQRTSPQAAGHQNSEFMFAREVLLRLENLESLGLVARSGGGRRKKRSSPRSAFGRRKHVGRHGGEREERVGRFIEPGQEPGLVRTWLNADIADFNGSSHLFCFFLKAFFKKKLLKKTKSVFF